MHRERHEAWRKKEGRLREQYQQEGAAKLGTRHRQRSVQEEELPRERAPKANKPISGAGQEPRHNKRVGRDIRDQHDYDESEEEFWAALGMDEEKHESEITREMVG